MLLEDIVLATPGTHIASWSTEEGALTNAALRPAAKIVARHHLANSVEHANMRQGLAPSSRSLLRIYNDFADSLADQGIYVPRAGLPRIHTSSSPRAFMNKWRRRQNILHGRIRFGEPLTLDQKRDKVQAFFSPHRPGGHTARFGGPARPEKGSKTGTFLGPPLSPYTRRPSNRGRLKAPTAGPQGPPKGLPPEGVFDPPSRQ